MSVQRNSGRLSHQACDLPIRLSYQARIASCGIGLKSNQKLVGWPHNLHAAVTAADNTLSGRSVLWHSVVISGQCHRRCFSPEDCTAPSNTSICEPLTSVPSVAKQDKMGFSWLVPVRVTGWQLLLFPGHPEAHRSHLSSSKSAVLG